MTKTKKNSKVTAKKKQKKGIKSSKEITKKVKKEEIIDMTERQGIYDLHPMSIYQELWNNIEKIRAWETAPEHMEYIKRYITRINDFSHTHWHLANTVPDKIVTSVVEVANNLIKEYDCNTTLEKTLCEVVANSYGKILSISKRLNESLSFDYFWHERNGFISIMSKELDRANRSYLSAMSHLIEIKEPKTQIHIKTKNAYMAQNQQFNNNDKNNENIKD